MIKKINTFLLSIFFAAYSFGATVQRDMLMVEVQGGSDHEVGCVITCMATDWPWSDYEAGVSVIPGINTTFDIAENITILDWMPNCICANTHDYEIDNEASPSKVVRCGTLAHLLVENNFDDNKGVYSWVENGDVLFDGTTVIQGSYSIGPILAGGGDYLSSAVTITEDIKQVEFRINRGNIAWNGTHKRIWECGDFYIAIAWDQLFLYYGGLQGVFTGITVNNWFDASFEFGGPGYGTKIFIDGVERASSAVTALPGNEINYWGADSGGSNECNCWLDDMRILRKIIDSKPTIGDY